jgi:hypothetical protein
MISELRTIGVRTHLQRGAVLALTRRTPRLIRRACLATALLVTIAAVAQPVHAAGGGQTKVQRISTQFIAALGDPGATSGSGAQSWGLWPLDPGPRGVELNSYKRLKEAGGVAPARWKFDGTDWWLEEHGLIMEQPTFPFPFERPPYRLLLELIHPPCCAPWRELLECHRLSLESMRSRAAPHLFVMAL